MLPRFAFCLFSSHAIQCRFQPSLWDKRLLDESKMFRDRGEWVFLTSEVDCILFCQQPRAGRVLSSSQRRVHFAPCSLANSVCLTSGRSWSTDISNTPFFPSPCMFRPFDSRHEVHLHPLPSHRDNTHALWENNHATGKGLQLTALARWDCEGGHIFILSATPEIFINTTHHPLINYTPAMDAPLIMNVFPIRTKAIDFCHSFEMDLLEGTFSLLSFNPSKQTSTEERKFSGQGQPLGCRRVFFFVVFFFTGLHSSHL